MDDTSKTTVARNGGPGLAPRRSARAELVWDGKYDADGRRVAPLRVTLPFQTVESVNESAQDRQRSLFAPEFHKGVLAQPADLGRQEVYPAVPAVRVRGQGEPHLHRPAIRHGCRLWTGLHPMGETRKWGQLTSIFVMLAWTRVSIGAAGEAEAGAP
jgi:hypothetical protein